MKIKLLFVILCFYCAYILYEPAELKFQVGQMVELKVGGVGQILYVSPPEYRIRLQNYKYRWFDDFEIKRVKEYLQNGQVFSCEVSNARELLDAGVRTDYIHMILISKEKR